MAFDYTEFQQDVGILIKHYDLQGTDGTNLEADRNAILSELADLSDVADTVVEGLATQFTEWEQQYVSRRAVLAEYALRRMQDRVSVLNEIGATSDQPAEVLSKLIEFYAANSKSVNASDVTLGSVSAGGSNVGNGTILLTKVLDGYSSPGSFSGVVYPPHLRYKGVNSELCGPASETITAICTADYYLDGRTEGGESFSLGGRPAQQQHGIYTEGVGDLPGINAIHATPILQNADFENFTSNVPDNWTLASGTAGTHVLSEGTEKYHGSYGLRFKGDGSQATIKITQAISKSQVQANRRYIVTARVKADATISAGTLSIIFNGTGYTAGGSESISVAHGSLPTSWTLYSFFVNMPASIPSDFALAIQWGSTPTNNKNLYIDDIGFAPVDYRAGFGLIAVRGSTPFVRGDKFTWTISNTEGVVQRFFRRAFGIQLPSDSGGSETWADSTAT